LKYSIIIPTLNEEKLLPQLLKQLTEGDKKEEYQYEIIISDGKSSDKTIEIALEFADIVIVHSGNSPQNIAEGRNKGAEIAEGDVLIFLNGDVILSSVDDFFSFLNNKFYGNEEYLAMTTFVKVFKEEELLKDKLFHWAYNNYFRLLNNIGMGMGRGECQIVRKSIFDEVNGYNCKMAAGEDFDLFKRIRKRGLTLFTNKLIVYESPRRFRKLGYSAVTWTWIKNGFSVVIKNRSLSKEWEQVR
jgi:glycosyltransferase involved in cell wall biosynthesis